LQVGFQWRPVRVSDWAGAARHRLAAEPCGAAARLVETLHEVGVVEQIAVGRSLRRPLGLAAAECRDAGQAVADIEGVGDLAELAVADAIDAGCDLLLDDLADSLGETSVKGYLLERPAGFARFQELQQIGRSRQAPDMGGENPFGARLHPRSPCAQARFMRYRSPVDGQSTTNRSRRAA
jgi:hypothetical protein